MAMIQAFFSMAGAFLITYFIIPVLIKVAYAKDLYDKPDEDRKLHTRYIPSLGGVAIFIAVVTGFLFSGYSHLIPGMPYLLGSLIGLFFCGLKDDIIGLSPWKKLAIEVSLCTVLLFGSGFIIKDLSGVFGIGEIPMILGFPLSLFTMIVVINAYNLIDGVDGLAGGIGTISSLSFSYVFFVSEQYGFAVLSLILSVVLISYLFHNFHPASIFMGDTGSLVIGFLLAVLALNLVPLSNNSGFANNFGNSSPILPVAFLALPLYDTIRSFLRRIRKGESPFNADSDHIHHVLIKMGWGQTRTVLYLYFAALAITIIGFTTSKLDVNVSLSIIVSSTVLFFPTNGFKRKIALKIGINLESLFKAKERVLIEELEKAQKKAAKESEFV